MEWQNILTILGGILATGIVYGRLSEKIKKLEQDIAGNRNNIDRLTTLEVKMDILINHFIKDK